MDDNGREHQPSGLPKGLAGTFTSMGGAGGDSDVPDLTPPSQDWGAHSIWHLTGDGFNLLSTYEDGERLASRLRTNFRRPMVVISADYRERVSFDPSDIADACGAGVDVFVLASHASDGFNRILPDSRKLGAFNGAMRAYKPNRGGSMLWLSRQGGVGGRTVADWLQVKRVERRQKKDETERLRHRVDELKNENDRLKREVEHLKSVSMYADASLLFSSNEQEERVDFELRNTWLVCTPSSARAKHPLPDSWEYDDGFLEDWPNIDRRIILRGMVSVLVDGGRRLDLHMLRDNVGGNSAPRVSKYGTPIWRVHLTRGAGGWSMHYTRDKDGRIHFLHVGHHDDMLR